MTEAEAQQFVVRWTRRFGPKDARTQLDAIIRTRATCVSLTVSGMTPLLLGIVDFSFSKSNPFSIVCLLLGIFMFEFFLWLNLSLKRIQKAFYQPTLVNRVYQK